MNNKLVLTVLSVMLSWLAQGIHAQNATTAPIPVAPTMTTAPVNMSTTYMTTAPENMTTTYMTTTAPVNMSTTYMTTTAPVNMSTTYMTTTGPVNMSTTAPVNMTTTAPVNMTTTAPVNMTTTAPVNMTTTAPVNMTTTAPVNMTTTHMTTTAPINMTTTAPVNMTTTAPVNMTTTAPVNMTTTAPVNTTMTPTTTTAGPLVPNITVSDLEMNISNSGCGTDKLCADEPMDCTPTAEGCLFFSAMQRSGQNFDLELSGESDGYIAATLSTDASVGGNDTTYVCANNNGNVQFFGALLNNGMLNVTELNVNSVRGSVTGRRIQCTFAATVPTSDTRVSSVSLAVSTGSFNATSGALGNPDIRIQSGVIDLANPRVNITNMITTTTTTPTTPTTTTSMTPTTCNAITHQLSLTQALLITLGVLTLTRL